MSKINVLHYEYTSNSGGIESLVFNMLKGLPSDIHFDFINEGDEPLANESELIKRGCKIYAIPGRYSNPIKHIKAIKKILDEGDYDFVHCHEMYLDEPTMILLTNKHRKTKTIIHCHSNFQNIQVSFKEKILQLITYVLTNNKYYLRLSCSNEGGKSMFGKKDFTLMQNGVDINKYMFSQENRNEIRNKYSLSENNIVIGHVGVANRQKNHEFILSVFKRLVSVNDNYRLLLVGDTDRINDLIIEDGLKKYVIQTGIISDVSKYYSAMDLFFFPSLFEGLPVSAIEAQANGLFCIFANTITKEVAISENVQFIPLVEDVAVEEILNNSNHKRMKDNCINDDYDIERFKTKMYDYYRDNAGN